MPQRSEGRVARSVLARQPRLAPSILSADFARLAEEIGTVEKAGADLIHVDVMDGHFVPNLTIGPVVVAALGRVTSLPLDVHLMIERPEESLASFLDAGADILTVHCEATEHLAEVAGRIQQRGILAGVSLKPATPLSAIAGVLDLVDLVLVMTVEPGFGGQQLIPHTVDKVVALERERSARGLSFLIEVDGGIGPLNIGRLRRAGADVFVAGSAVFGAADRAEALDRLRQEIARAEMTGENEDA